MTHSYPKLSMILATMMHPKTRARTLEYPSDSVENCGTMPATHSTCSSTASPMIMTLSHRVCNFCGDHVVRFCNR